MYKRQVEARGVVGDVDEIGAQPLADHGEGGVIGEDGHGARG